MNLFLHLLTKNPKNEPESHALATDHVQPNSTSEGSEFVDDVIRVEEEPFGYNNIKERSSPDSA